MTTKLFAILLVSLASLSYAGASLVLDGTPEADHFSCISNLQKYARDRSLQIKSDSDTPTATSTAGSVVTVWNKKGRVVVNGQQCNMGRENVTTLFASIIKESPDAMFLLQSATRDTNQQAVNNLFKDYNGWLASCAADSDPLLSQAAKDVIASFKPKSSTPLRSNRSGRSVR